MPTSRASFRLPGRILPGRRRLKAILLLITAGVLVCLPGPARAASEGNGLPAPENDLALSFDVAARHWQVPEQVLMAIGYVESHWEQRPGEPSIDGGYGVMHLVDGPGGSLGRAAALTGLPVDALKEQAAANIEGGAAVLHDISLKLNTNKPDQKNFAGWYEAVRVYSGALDPTVSSGYAQEVFRVVIQGQSAQVSTGEKLALAPSPVQGIPAPASAPASDDYPPALWVPANPSNYTVGRPYGSIDFIVIHDTEGSYSSAISWFQNPSSGVSAHYVIRSADGQITQMVREANTAYHAGNWDYNVRAVGVEHEGYANQQGWYTEAMYQSSAALVRSIADRYGVHKDRVHIIGHYQIPGTTHNDPGPYWDWSHYMSLVRQDSSRAALVDNTDPGFVPVPSTIDPAHYWWSYQGGYNSSNTYTTYSVSNPVYSVNSGTWSASLPATGFYDLYAFVPWVNNSRTDTSHASYQVHASNGVQTVVISQKAITDLGDGSWAHLGKFYFDGGTPAQVTLTDYTGEANLNVWFDAMMWIPTTGGPPPTPLPTATGTVLPPTQVPTAVSPSPTVPVATPTPGPCGMQFSDLPDTEWSYSYVAYLYCNGVISGYGDGTFRPGENSTRGQFAKMLTLAFYWTPYSPSDPTYADVPADSPFYQFVEAATLRGVINGYPCGGSVEPCDIEQRPYYRPGAHITRAQVAKLLVLAHNWSPYFPQTPTFPDVPSSHWAYGYIEAAVQFGIISGYSNGTFGPENSVTRAQLSKMITLAIEQGLAPGGRRSLPAPSPTRLPEKVPVP